MLGTVDEVARLLVIRLQKILGHNLQRLSHTFTDGDAGHNDDEFAPAILLVQLENGFDVVVSLAGACFHLDVEIHLADFGLHQFCGLRQVLMMLYLIATAKAGGCPLKQFTTACTAAVW